MLPNWPYTWSPGEPDLRISLPSQASWGHFPIDLGIGVSALSSLKGGIASRLRKVSSCRRRRRIRCEEPIWVRRSQATLN
jgi:hypothetical protein